MNDLDLPLRSPALYNPHLLSRDELLALFSAREDLLEELLADLRDTPVGEPAQHHLVIGQRGMGKTMLLRRLQCAVEDEQALSKAWLALSFPEEQYNVVTLSDFWLNCVDALSDILEAKGGASEAVEALDRAVDEIRDVRDESARANRALDALVAAAKVLDRRLLLLVDNADLILDRIGKQDWTLREVLSSQTNVTFIGASAAMLESSYEYGRAFYDFFKIHELAGLSVEETKRFLLRYAEAQENPHIREVVENEPARLRTLHTLTGGNPRTLVLLFNIFAHGPDGDVRSDLEQLLDQCTPLYKARFEALPAQAQQVVDALALHWDPVSAGELADSLRMNTNQVSAQLNRLHQMGVVEKVPYEPTSKAGFQIAERFFNIWYLMRASRRVRRRLVWLVEFLRMFYGQEELRDHVKRHLRMAKNLAPQERLRHVEYGFALASAFDEGGMRWALERNALQMLAKQEDLRGQLRDFIDLSETHVEFRSRAEYVEQFESLRRALRDMTSDLGDSLEPGFDEILLRAPLGIEAKREVIEILRKPDTERAKELVEYLNERERTFFELLGSDEVTDTIHTAFRDGYMLTLDDIDGARIVEQALDAVGLVSVASTVRAVQTKNEADIQRLEETLAESISLFPLLEWLHLRGSAASPEILKTELDRVLELPISNGIPLKEIAQRLEKLNLFEQAVSVRRRASVVEPSSYENWNNLGSMLMSLNRTGEAATALERAIEIDPAASPAWINLSMVYSKQGDPNAAEDALRRAADLKPQGLGSLALGRFLMHHERLEEAEKSLRRSIDLAPEQGTPWLELGNLLWKQDRMEEAEEAYRRAVEVAPERWKAWRSLGLLLARQGRADEAEAALRKAIALDPEDSVSRNAVAWMSFVSNRPLDEAESLARESVELDPSPEAQHTLACILVRNGKWNEATAPSLQFLRAWAAEVPDGLWPDVIVFFREAVAAGKAREAITLLDELDLGERWRPLCEALEAIARDSDTYLRRVAPEVREPAEAILKELREPIETS